MSSSLEGLSWEVRPAEEEKLAEAAAISGYQVDVTVPDDLASGAFKHWLILDIRRPRTEGEVAEDSAAEDAEDGSAESAEPYEKSRMQLAVVGRVQRDIAILADESVFLDIIDLGTIPHGRGKRHIMTVLARNCPDGIQILDVEKSLEFLNVSLQPRGETSAGSFRYDMVLEVPEDAPSGNYALEPHPVTIRTDHPRSPNLSFNVKLQVLSRGGAAVKTLPQ